MHDYALPHVAIVVRSFNNGLSSKMSKLESYCGDEVNKDVGPFQMKLDH